MNDNQKKLNEQLAKAVKSGNKKAVKYLIYIGADVFYFHEEKSLLKIAKESDDKEIANVLLEKMSEEFEFWVNGADGEKVISCLENLKNPQSEIGVLEKTRLGKQLYDALVGREQDRAIELILKGADVNYREPKKGTPVIEAAVIGNLEILKMLVERGGNVNARYGGIGGSSVLIYAVGDGQNLEMVEYLISKGADVNYVSKTQKSALLWACDIGSFELAKCLIDNGADVCQHDEDRESCLMYAAKRGNFQLVQMLVQKGANVMEKSNFGRTVLHYANEGRNKEVIEFISNKIKEANKEANKETIWQRMRLFSR